MQRYPMIENLHRRLVPLTSGGSAVATLLLAGCGEKITVYEAPSDAPPQAAAHGHGDPHQRPAMPKLTWDKLPAGWTEEAGGEMRAATFHIKDDAGEPAAEVGVFPFPEAAGLKDLQLVNMWREQLRLEQLSESELDAQREMVQVGDAEGRLYHIAGGTNQIFSVIAPREGWMWFFKLAGNADVVAAQKPAFVNFLKDVGFTAPVAAAPTPSAPSDAGPDTPDWKVPASWKTQPAGMMQMAKFSSSGKEGDAEVSVARLGGMAGGLGPNINRWRGQLGLPSVDDAAATAMAKPLTTSEGNARLVELAGADRAMTVVMVSHDGATWFYKLTGTPGAVEREKPALVEFVNSVKYP